MRKAAGSKETVVVFNFGWYYGEEEGYNRKGGHWVAVVGAGFLVTVVLMQSFPFLGSWIKRLRGAASGR